MIILVAMHLSIIWVLFARYDFINKLAGTIMQVLGGLIVLRAVNKDLGLFRSQSFSSIVISWFKYFAIKKKVIHTCRIPDYYMVVRDAKFMGYIIRICLVELLNNWGQSKIN